MPYIEGHPDHPELGRELQRLLDHDALQVAVLLRDALHRGWALDERLGVGGGLGLVVVVVERLLLLRLGVEAPPGGLLQEIKVIIRHVMSIPLRDLFDSVPEAGKRAPTVGNCC